MQEKYKNKIYDRLLSIKLKIEVQSFPNPQYINEKIGECHVYIDEIERYSIETTREVSAMQQALNNAVADYEVKKENFLIHDKDIKSLPNIKDREAKANSQLESELKQIKEYENILIDLNNLLKAINLKIKNLNRANTDIKVMIRVLESQIKLGMAPATDSIMKSLIEEINKGKIDADSFEDVKTEVIEEDITDPTSDIDIDDILSSSEVTSKYSESISEKLIEPIPKIESISVSTEPEIIESIPLIIEEDWPEIDTKISIDESDSKIVDMDLAFDFSKKGGNIETKKSEEMDNTIQKEDHQQKNEIGIDIDDLLNSIT